MAQDTKPLSIVPCTAPQKLCKAVPLKEHRLAPGFYLASRLESETISGLGEIISSLLLSPGGVSVDSNYVKLK